jgi:hypothetical protein
MSDSVKIVTQTTYLYVFLDDVLKSLGISNDCRRHSSDSEILTTGLVAALHFGGNHADAIGFVKEAGLMPSMIGESRFSRRWHALSDVLADLVFQLGHVIKELNAESGIINYRIDSFPLRSCHNIRINRSKLFKGAEFRGYNASKREYFYGIKVFVITDGNNVPVEYSFTPGSWAEIDGFRQMPLELPEDSELYGDSGFTDYSHEENLLDGQKIDMKIARKKNSKRQHQPWWNFLIQQERKPIEATFSEMTATLSKKIHAVTQKGFLMKVVALVLAFLIDSFIN